MIRLTLARGAIVFGLVLVPRIAAAQSFAPMAGRYELAVGGRVIAGGSLGAVAANETRDVGGVFTLFSTESRLKFSKAFETRFGVRISRAFQVEASASFGNLVLNTDVSADVEGAPDITATESLNELTIEGAFLWHAERWAPGPRVVPLVWVGGGYLGHLHEQRHLLERGAIFESGVGVNVWLREASASSGKGMGLRLDGRGVVRVGGAALDRRARLAPGGGASLFVRF